MKFRFKTNNKQVMGDLHTPVSIYLKVRDIYPESALLESSDFHGNENSLSYIALCPLASIGINSGKSTFVFPDGNREITSLTDTYCVVDALNNFLSCFSVEGENSEECGLFGYTAFDSVRYFEPVAVAESHHEENDAPDMLYILYRYIIVFNHFKNELTLVEILLPGEQSSLQEIENIIESFKFTKDLNKLINKDQELKVGILLGIGTIAILGIVYKVVKKKVQKKKGIEVDEFL